MKSRAPPFLKTLQLCVLLSETGERIVSDSATKVSSLEMVRYVEAMKCCHIFPDVLFVLTTISLSTALEIKYLQRQGNSGNHASSKLSSLYTAPEIKYVQR